MRAGHARVRLHDRHCRACAAARSVLPAARRASGAAVLASSGSFQAHGTSSLCGAALAAQRRRRRPRSTRREKPHRIALLPPVGSALHAPAASSADTSAVWPGLSQALGYAGGCGARRAPHARGAHQGDGAGSVARRCSHASSSARRAHPSKDNDTAMPIGGR